MVDRIVKKRKYAVLIATYGEVERLTLRNLWPSTRRIVSVITRQFVKGPKLLVYMLADHRSMKRFIDWRLHNYESSLVETNRTQTRKVRESIALSDHPILSSVEVSVLESYFFVPPYLENMLHEGQSVYDGVIVVPMIPVESAFSCGVACQAVNDVYGDRRFARVRLLNKLWQNPELHRIYTDYLFQQVDRSYVAKGRKTGLVLVIHGTLVRDRAGNPPKVFTGLNETGEFFEMMKQRILDDPRNVFHGIKQGCMNHTAGGEWTSDTVQKAFREFLDEGYDSVVMFPYGFFADNSETEYEARTLLEKTAFTYKQYVRCINGYTEFAEWLASRIIDDIEKLDALQDALGNRQSTIKAADHA